MENILNLSKDLGVKESDVLSLAKSVIYQLKKNNMIDLYLSRDEKTRLELLKFAFDQHMKITNKITTHLKNNPRLQEEFCSKLFNSLK